MRGQIFVEGTPPTILPLSTYPPPCAIPRVIPAPNARGTHAARTGRRRQAQAGAGRRRRIGAHVSHGRAKVLPVSAWSQGMGRRRHMAGRHMAGRQSGEMGTTWAG